MEMKTLILLATVQSDFPEMNVLLTNLSFVLFARFTFDGGRSHHKGGRERKGTRSKSTRRDVP